MRIVTPVSTPLLVVPKAWTPGTEGAVRGPAMKVKIEKEADADALKGKLAGRVLLVAEPREIKDLDKPLFDRYSDGGARRPRGLRAGAPAAGGAAPGPRGRAAADAPCEAAPRVLQGGRRAGDAGAPATASGGIVRVSGGGSRETGEDPGVPALVMAAEHYNRLARLVDSGRRSSSRSTCARASTTTT